MVSFVDSAEGAMEGAMDGEDEENGQSQSGQAGRKLVGNLTIWQSGHQGKPEGC